MSKKFSVPRTSESVTSGQAGGVFRQLYSEYGLSNDVLYQKLLQVLCEAVQSREVNKSQLPRILNKIKLHISIEEQYTLSTQVSQFHRVHHQENAPFCFCFSGVYNHKGISHKEGAWEGAEKVLSSC
jgi:hypothetical protein